MSQKSEEDSSVDTDVNDEKESGPAEEDDDVDDQKLAPADDISSTSMIIKDVNIGDAASRSHDRQTSAAPRLEDAADDDAANDSAANVIAQDSADQDLSQDSDPSERVDRRSREASVELPTSVHHGAAAVELAAMDSSSEEELFLVGDVVWCLQRGNPWWPCLVTNEFNSEEHSRYVNSGSRSVKQYHVQFFGPKPLHAWVGYNSVRRFAHRDEVSQWKERDAAIFKKMSKIRREKAMKAYVPTAKAVIMELDAAKDEAERALEMPVTERLDVFEFDYHSVDASSSLTAAAAEMTSDRRRIKFTPLKPGTTVITMSADNGGRVLGDGPSPINSGILELKPSMTTSSLNASSSSSSLDLAVVSSPSFPTTSSIGSAILPPSKRRRTLPPGVMPTSFQGFSINNLNNNHKSNHNHNNNNNNDSVDAMEDNGSYEPLKPVKYAMTSTNSTTNGFGIQMIKPEMKFSIAENHVKADGLVGGRVFAESSMKMAAELDGDNEDDHHHHQNYSDVKPLTMYSAKDSLEAFSKFSLCHAAEMRSLHPEMAADDVEASLKSRWNAMTDEEANWYIYNGVPPGKLLPGKKRLRPGSAILDKLSDWWKRRNEMLTA